MGIRGIAGTLSIQKIARVAQAEIGAAYGTIHSAWTIIIPTLRRAIKLNTQALVEKVIYHRSTPSSLKLRNRTALSGRSTALRSRLASTKLDLTV